ncbi:MAG: LPS export ABC transporter periplasmic protein LptC [Nitrospirae bacterium]|nr:LPS export ABC transporter periplasmic protein LptC [Nitrospirota bacterium]
MKKILLPSALFIAIVFVVFFIGIAFKKENSNNDAIRPSGSFIEGLRIAHREGGTLRWSLSSKSALLSEDEEFAYLREVKVTLPDRDIEVSGERGTYDMESKDLSMKGDIKAWTKDYVIKTESIKLQAGHELLTEDTVVLEGKRLKIQGKGLKATHDKWILKDVTAEFF